MRKLKVIYIPVKTESNHQRENFILTVSDRHQVTIYDHDKPVAEQFKDQVVVVDQGGSAGTHEMMDAAVDARLWQILGTGLDHVDLAYLKNRGLTACHTPGEHTAAPMAEIAMMMIVMLVRQYNASQEIFQQRRMHRPVQPEVHGLALGIIGFGATGRALATRATAFGMRIQAVDIVRSDPQVLADHGVEACVMPDDLDRVIGESDVLSLHLHLNDQTRHIIDARRIALMKPNAYLVNVSRGDLVDEHALHKALLSDRIGGAGLDVYATEPADPQEPVYSLPNVITTPHNSSTTQAGSLRRCACVLENIDRVAQNLDPLHGVV